MTETLTPEAARAELGGLEARVNLLRAYLRQRVTGGLTRMERLVADSAVEGASDEAVAQLLGMRVGDYRARLVTAMAKLGVRDVAGLATALTDLDSGL